MATRGSHPRIVTVSLDLLDHNTEHRAFDPNVRGLLVSIPSEYPAGKTIILVGRGPGGRPEMMAVDCRVARSRDVATYAESPGYDTHYEFRIETWSWLSPIRARDFRTGFWALMHVAHAHLEFLVYRERTEAP